MTLLEVWVCLGDFFIIRPLYIRLISRCWLGIVSWKPRRWKTLLSKSKSFKSIYICMKIYFRWFTIFWYWFVLNLVVLMLDKRIVKLLLYYIWDIFQSSYTPLHSAVLSSPSSAPSTFAILVSPTSDILAPLVLID